MAPFLPAKNIATLLYKMGKRWYDCPMCNRSIDTDWIDYSECRFCLAMLCSGCTVKMVIKYNDNKCNDERCVEKFSADILTAKNDTPSCTFQEKLRLSDRQRFCDNYGTCGHPLKCDLCDEDHLKKVMDDIREEIEKRIDSMIEKNEKFIADRDFLTKIREYLKNYEIAPTGKKRSGCFE